MSLVLLAADDEELELKAIDFLVKDRRLPFRRVVYASNGDDAVRLALDNKADVALLDIRMPGKDGLVAAAEIRASRPWTAIIFLTAYDDFEFARSALRLKAEDYLLKPVSGERFEIAMRAAILSLRDLGVARSLRPERRAEITFPRATSDIGIEEAAQDESAAILVTRFLEYIENHLTEPISLESASRIVGLSSSYFSRMFTVVTGRSFTEHLGRLRINAAMELLERRELSIKSVCAMVGYRDPNNFSTAFKRLTGYSPKEFRACRMPLVTPNDGA